MVIHGYSLLVVIMVINDCLLLWLNLSFYDNVQIIKRFINFFIVKKYEIIVLFNNKEINKNFLYIRCISRITIIFYFLSPDFHSYIQTLKNLVKEN